MSVNAGIVCRGFGPGTSTGGGSGPGGQSVVLQCKDGAGNILEGAAVWLSSDLAGSTVIAGAFATDSDGEVTFMLDPGTYYCWRQLTGYNFTNPEEFTIE